MRDYFLTVTHEGETYDIYDNGVVFSSQPIVNDEQYIPQFIFDMRDAYLAGVDNNIPKGGK